MTRKGWQNEGFRHSMARRKIPTVFKGVAKGKKNHFATGKSLQKFLETPEGQIYEQQHFESLFEIPWGGYEYGIPYWIDNYEDEVTGEHYFGGHSQNKDGNFTDAIIEHVPGMYDLKKYGDITTFNDGENFHDRIEYYYAGSVGSSEEMEHQAENGELVYSNIGSNFFRIWKPVPETYITESPEGDYYLMHQGSLEGTTKNNPRLDSPEKMMEYAKKVYPKIQNLLYNSSKNSFEPFMNYKQYRSIVD